MFQSEHNRQITLSIGGNRKETNWKPQIVTVEELYDRLNRKYADPKEFAVWHRLCFEKNLLEGKTVVFGHTPTKHVMAQLWPTMRIFHNDDAINIDCGCAYPGLGGQLGCLRLEDMTEFYSTEGVVTTQEAVDWKREMGR